LRNHPNHPLNGAYIMKNLLLRACLITLAFLSMPIAIAPATAQGLPTVRGPSCFSASGPIAPCIGMFLADPTNNGNPITPPAAPTTYPLLTAATPSPASTPPAGTYKLLLPATFNGATITLSITTANQTVSTFAYTSVPSPIPCFPIAAGDTISASVSGGTPTGNTVFAGATRCGSGDVSPAAFTQAALVASGKTAVTFSFTATGASAALTPIAGRQFNVTISGGVAVCQVERSFDAGSTWFVALSDSIRTSIPESFTLIETEVGVQYRVNCPGYTSGTVAGRISM
jgi:hypothetical protein